MTDLDSLVSSRNDVFELDGTVIGNTTTSIGTRILWQSAEMLESKMSNKKLFDEVLQREPTEDEPTCRDANMVSQDLSRRAALGLINNLYRSYLVKICCNWALS